MEIILGILGPGWAMMRKFIEMQTLRVYLVTESFQYTGQAKPDLTSGSAHAGDEIENLVAGFGISILVEVVVKMAVVKQGFVIPIQKTIGQNMPVLKRDGLFTTLKAVAAHLAI